MAFVKPVTIQYAINKIHKKEFLLPAIQREFVWDTYQIERLFDSLMRDYPISSFLFWEVEKNNIHDYQFYEFVRQYHERDNSHNPKADLNGEEGIVAILDGQQRLTSLYIGLKGTYANKLPRKRWDNDDAFPKRKLCLNLTRAAKNGDMNYDFKFLTEQEKSESKGDCHWYSVGDILDLAENADVNDYLLDNGLMSLDPEKSKFASRTLFKLWKVINDTESINFFLEKDKSLDKVLNIFIRVNSGGTQLSYSDLLLSIATAQWKKRDAREEITSFVDELNRVGDGFAVNKDFVLKCCLVLSDFSDIAFKVDNFNKDNMLSIEKNWDKISAAIKLALKLVSNFGYHRDTLTSYNAIIPIAYYLYKIESPNNFVESTRHQKDRETIRKWLIIALLKRTFSGQPDNVLRPLREVIKLYHDAGFPFDSIVKKFKGTLRSMTFDDDEISNLFYYQYGQSYTFSILALLYPSLDFRNKFHQDHIFPKKIFTEKKLEKKGIDPDKIEIFMDNFNYIANLQLLEGIPNQEKSGKPFSKWIKEQYPDKTDRNAYMKRNYIPNIDLSLENFDEFVDEREELLTSAFKKLLA